MVAGIDGHEVMQSCGHAVLQSYGLEVIKSIRLQAVASILASRSIGIRLCLLILEVLKSDTG
jgi:methylmalonyl-CoA mutase cobalamin-binding subunit